MLGTLSDFPEGTMSIGRLDENSEGLLLLTTDGKVSEQVRSKKIEKEYFVQIEGIIDETATQKLRDGVLIKLRHETYKTLACKVHRLDPSPVFKQGSAKVRHEGHGPTSWISITLREGKFRQVRKMTAAVGFPTVRLIRVRIGNIEINNLESGEVIEVDRFELVEKE